MSSSRPIHDREAAVGPLTRAQSIEGVLQFALEKTKDMKKDSARKGGDAARDECLTSMIEVFETAIERILLTTREDQLEELNQRAHAWAAEIMRAWSQVSGKSMDS